MASNGTLYAGVCSMGDTIGGTQIPYFRGSVPQAVGRYT